VTAHSVPQRMREIGVRIALGARQSQVMALVLRQSVVLTVAGISSGLAGAAGTISRTILLAPARIQSGAACKSLYWRRERDSDSSQVRNRSRFAILGQKSILSIRTIRSKAQDCTRNTHAPTLPPGPVIKRA
jgi:hypothetical protein